MISGVWVKTALGRGSTKQQMGGYPSKAAAEELRPGDCRPASSAAPSWECVRCASQVLYSCVTSLSEARNICM